MRGRDRTTVGPRETEHDRVARRSADLLQHAKLQQAGVVLEHPSGVREGTKGGRLATSALERRFALSTSRDDPSKGALQLAGNHDVADVDAEQLDADSG